MGAAHSAGRTGGEDERVDCGIDSTIAERVGEGVPASLRPACLGRADSASYLRRGARADELWLAQAALRAESEEDGLQGPTLE